MKMDKKLEHYLSDAHIDFGEFHILEVIPQNEKKAVVLLAPRKYADLKRFCMQDNGRHLYYCTVEQMMAVCVECGYLSKREADKLAREYYTWKNSKENY